MAVPQLEQLPIGPTGVVSQALIVTVDMDDGAVGHTGGGVLAQELSVMVVGGSVSVDAGPVGQTGVTLQEVSVMVVAGAHEEGGVVGQTEVAGQLPISISVVVTVEVPAVGQVLGPQEP